VYHYPTPENDAEAAALVREIEHAVDRFQLGDAERMAYELVRFHWRRHACRLEGAYRLLDSLATRNLGAALEECAGLRSGYAPAPRLVA
jgi:hypothetical protein